MVHNDIKVLGLFLLYPMERHLGVWREKASNSRVPGTRVSTVCLMYRKWTYSYYIIFSVKTAGGHGCRRTRLWHEQDMTTGVCYGGGCLYLQKAKKQAELVLVESTGNGSGPPVSVFWIGTDKAKLAGWDINIRKGELSLVMWLAVFTGTWCRKPCICVAFFG